MWELDCKESWALKNWCFWTVVLEKTLESPLDSKEIQPVNPSGNQSWILIGRTDAEAPVLWLPDVKSWLNGNETDAGKDWRQKEKEATEDEMVGWHHQLNGHESEQTLGDTEGQVSVAWYSPYGHRVAHSWATERHHQQCVRAMPQLVIKSYWSWLPHLLQPVMQLTISTPEIPHYCAFPWVGWENEKPVSTSYKQTSISIISIRIIFLMSS